MLDAVLCALSRVWLFATPWTGACQARLSMEFSRQEYWSGFPCLLQGVEPTQGSNPGLPHCGWTLYHLNHQGSPLDIWRNLFWIPSKQILFARTLALLLPYSWHLKQKCYAWKKKSHMWWWYVSSFFIFFSYIFSMMIFTKSPNYNLYITIYSAVWCIIKFCVLLHFILLQILSFQNAKLWIWGYRMVRNRKLTAFNRWQRGECLCVCVTVFAHTTVSLHERV